MDLNTLKSAIAILENLGSENVPDTIREDGRKVIVRSRDAGVVYGEIIARSGADITLQNARQLWKWQAAKGITLIDVATAGVKARGCKFSTETANIVILNACALIDVSSDAAASIEGV